MSDEVEAFGFPHLRLGRPEETPAYPAGLLDDLAKALAAATLAALPSSRLLHPFVADRRQEVLAAFDRYSEEVGREKVPLEVDLAIAELGG